MTDTLYIDKLAYIFIKDKKILVTKSKGKDTWYIPGGKREAGESDTDALTREVKEELTVDLIPETIQYFETYTAQAHGKAEGTIVRMTCYTAEFIGELQPNQEIEDMDFFEYDQVDQTSPVDHLIMADLYAKKLIK